MSSTPLHRWGPAVGGLTGSAGRAVVMAGLLLAVVVPVTAQEQTGSVTGRVVDAANGRGIAGAQVSVVGTKRGTVSGEDGRYLVVSVPAGARRVEARTIGYGTKTVDVTVEAGRAVTADFQLQQEAISLEEVVVTGTAGASRRKEVGNTVASIDMSRLQDVKPVTDVSDVLQAQVVGLQQFTTGGQVGAGKQIRLRGNTSITQGNTPLIYVDGVRLVGAAPPNEGAQQETTALDLLNADDIARIEVIKGAAATTLYGTEASSGVIQIFTKRGGEGKTVWSFDVKGGARFMTANGLGSAVGGDPNWVSLKPWLRTGPAGTFSGSVRGNTQGIGYYLSGGYDYEQGVLPTQDVKRTSFRTNLNFEPMSNVHLDVNTGYTHQFTNWVQSGDNSYGAVLNLLRSPKNYTSGNDAAIFDQVTGTLDDHFTGGITATVNPWPSITNRFTAGLDWRDETNSWTVPLGNVLFASGRRSADRFRHTTATIDYVGTWSADITRGYTSQFSWGFQVFNDYDQRIFGTTQDFSGPGQDQTLSSGAITNSSESILKVVNAGFFFQELLGAKDHLFLTGGLRVDGNSAFGQDFGLQAYPKVSASWVVSDYGFWPKWWQVMKLRAAVGMSGKAPGVFDATRTYTPIAGNEGKPGITPDNLGDPKLGPERTLEREVGFETNVLDNRVSGEFTWYQATTSDALVPVQYPPSEGFANPQLTNVGKIQNRGVELALGLAPIQSDEVKWEARIQFSTNYSKALNLDGARLQIGFQSWRNWAIEGYPVPGYWDFKVTNPNAVADPILSDTIQYFGPVYPTHNWQLSTTLTLFNRLTIYALGEQAGGHYLLNAVARQNAVRGLWPECTNKLKAGADNLNALWRSRCVNLDWSSWIEPADYFKLRTVSVTYQIPRGLIPQASSAALTIAGNNLWKSTQYSGLDPEITRGDTFLEKREYYGLPPTQYITAALRITF
jgi:TonB-dependent starch-binding outer membrane protein SusC